MKKEGIHPPIPQTVKMERHTDDSGPVEAFIIENRQAELGNVPNDEARDKDVKTKEHRKNLIITICICWSIWILGWTYGQLGTSFPDLQQILKASLRKASLIFTMNSLGYVAGAFIFGVIYDRLGNAFTILSLLAVGVAITSVALPWCTTYGLFLAVRIIGGLCCGGIDSTGNAKVVSCWGKGVRQYMQMVHFSYAFGGIIAPLATSPFLSARQTKFDNITQESREQLTVVSNMSSGATEDLTNMHDLYIHNMSSIASYDKPKELIVYGETRVHYAFIISGILTLLTTVAFVWLICLGYENKRDSKERSVVKENGDTEFADGNKYPKMTLKQRLFVLTGLSVFVFFYGSIECKMVSFLMPFVLLQMNWTKQFGAILISILWAMFAAGRFGGIFISRCLRSTKMIGLFLITLIVSAIGVLFGGLLKVDVLIWMFIPLSGASMSVIFPTLIVWVNEHVMKVSGKMSALFNAFGSLGFMIGPLYVGNLMDNISPMFFVYVHIVEIFLCSIVFIVLVLAVKLIKNKASLEIVRD